VKLNRSAGLCINVGVAVVIGRAFLFYSANDGYKFSICDWLSCLTVPDKKALAGLLGKCIAYPLAVLVLYEAERNSLPAIVTNAVSIVERRNEGAAATRFHAVDNELLAVPSTAGAPFNDLAIFFASHLGAQVGVGHSPACAVLEALNNRTAARGPVVLSNPSNDAHGMTLSTLIGRKRPI
jgi:hypothetical protein